MNTFKNKYFGGSISFYKKVASIGIPGILQHMLQNACSIVDSMMVSWIGHVSSVGTASQVDIIVSTISYGINTGTGMFASQFYGAKDIKNLKKCFGLKLIMQMINGFFFMILSLFAGKYIMAFYMNDPFVIEYGTKYLQLVCLSFIPACINYGFAHMYRSVHKANIPFYMSVMTMFINMALNYILIFGKFGFPNLGVVGAAYGTLSAQLTTCIVYFVYSYKTNALFIGTMKEMFDFDRNFVNPILRKTFPLIMNELLFSFGNTLFIKAFGVLGKDAMDAYFVGNKIADMFYFFVWGLSDATTVILATSLGSGEKEKALRQSNYFVGIGVVLSVLLSICIVFFSSPLVALFGLENKAAIISAIWIVQAFSVKISLRLFNTLIFACMRAGGASKTLMILDSGITWAVGIPIAFIVVYFTPIKEIALVFLIVQLEALVRVIIGMKLFKEGNWANNLTRLVK